MQDQTLIWITDTELEVTSFTARLRDLAGIGEVYRRVHLSDLWSKDCPYSVAVTAHRWALSGETVTFEAPAYGATYRFELEPLHAPDGRITGVSGQAIALGEPGEARTSLRPHVDAERHAGLGTWQENLLTGHVTVSAGLASLLGIDANATSLDLRAFDHPEDRDAIARVLDDPDSAEGYTCDHRVLCRDSRVRAVRERVSTILDNRGVAVARIGTLIDITDLKEREAELAELALYDSLTNLPNRALLRERLAAAVARCTRYDSLCAVLFIDLDGFKAANDSFGHDAGDRLLAGVAQRLQRQVRATDTVARLSGDEFVVVLEDLYSEEAAISAAHKILRCFDEPFDIDDRPIAIGASIGIATAPRCTLVPSELLAMADREMYVVKHNGGGGVKIVALAGEESALPAYEKESCTSPFSKDRVPYETLRSA